MAYLYRHIRLDTNSPFYIGIGSDNKYIRANESSNRNKWWKNISNKSKIDVQIMLDDLTWEEACEKEKEFIALYGRKDLGKGNLVNLTDGGEGCLGRIMTAECIAKIAESNRGKKLSKERVEQMSKMRLGVKLSESQKANISKALKGKKKTKEHIENSAKSRKGIVCWKAIEQAKKANTGKKHSQETIEKRISSRTKTNHTLESIQKMREVAIELGRTKSIMCINNGIIYDSISKAERELCVNNIQKVLNGHIKHTKGYVFKRITELESQLKNN
jgi:hypothetical protein